MSADGTCIYFMGIIDILTVFGKKKVLENLGKSIIYDKETISCVPPVQYGDRFYKFMKEKVFVAADKNKKIEVKKDEMGVKK